MRVLIVGAGMSGLTLAILLKKAGVDCKLIERSNQIEDIGFLLFFYKGCSDVLKELGVWPQVVKKSRTFPAYKVISPNHQEMLTFDLLPEPALQPSRIIKRHDLHTILAKKLGLRNITFNAQVTRLRQTPKHTVIVTFSDGSQEEFDVVVAADGVHSKIRSKTFSNFSYGNYGWQSMLFWAKDSTYQKDYVEHVAAKDKYFLRSRDMGNGCVVYFAVKHTGTADLAFFRKRFQDNPLASKLLASMTSSEVYKSPIYRVTSENYVKDRIVLIGDAAHAISPLLALGTTLALQDAFVLAKELISQKDIDLSLKQYEQKRQEALSQPLQIMDKFMDRQAKINAVNTQLIAHLPVGWRERVSRRMVQKFVDLQRIEP